MFKKLFSISSVAIALGSQILTPYIQASSTTVSAITCKESYTNGDLSVSCVEPRFPYLGQYRRISAYSNNKAVCKLMGYDGDHSSIIQDVTAEPELLVSILKPSHMKPVEYRFYAKVVTCK